MKQYEIAKHLGISEQAVSKWFNGKSMPSTANLIALSKLLGMNIESTLKLLKRKQKRK